MIRLRQIKVLVKDDNLKEKISKKLNILSSEIEDIKIVKKSIDARCKPDIYYVYEVDVLVTDEEKVLKHNKNDNIFKSPIEEYNFKIAF